MSKRIAILIGHPDPDPARFGRRLAEAYAEAAEQAGHRVRRIDVAELDIPWLRGKREWETAPAPECLRPAQEAVAWADHLVLIYPLWLGALPAAFKGFLEQLLRPGFAFAAGTEMSGGARPLAGKSARIVVTMGMPALVYRWYFGAHSVKNLERNILRFVGIRPVRSTLIGLVEASAAGRRRGLERVARLGRAGR